ncbi:MAG: terpene cyclase/mutase family protein [Thermoplasmata archaeon]|nr:terpene cyclase/mutase family protein [Thermoplasmata archaeon]
MNIDRTKAYIIKHGNLFEQARLKHTVGRKYSQKDVLQSFSEMQNPDGGFPYGDRRGFPSCLSNTTMALSNLIDMGLADSEPALKSFRFMDRMKKSNGSWEENDKIAPLDPPFWDIPGDEESTIWLTAASAEILRKAGKPVPRKTLDFLRKKQGPDGKFEGYIHTTWIAMAIFGNQSPVTSASLKYLETADIGDWDATCISWCLSSMKLGGVSADSGLRKKLLDRLSELQEPDGSWPSEGGIPAKVQDANAVLFAVMDIIKNENINA